MNDDSIILVKLYSGDMIMGENTSLSCSSIVMSNPRSLVMAPTMRGDIKVLFAMVSEPFHVKRLSEKLTINPDQILFTIRGDEIEKELLDGYKSEVTGIKIASAAEAAAINSAPKPGEFVLQ